MTSKGLPLARRIMASWLARLAIDRWRQANPEADREPTALVAETAHGLRLAAVNAAGLRAGAAPEMMLTDARAICPALKIAARDAPDGLLVDVSAVAHLFGGEAELLADVHARFAAQGLTARAAIAPTGGAAWALAHYGPARALLAPEDDAEACLAALPVASLRLAGDTLLVLRRLGLTRL